MCIIEYVCRVCGFKTKVRADKPFPRHCDMYMIERETWDANPQRWKIVRPKQAA